MQALQAALNPSSSNLRATFQKLYRLKDGQTVLDIAEADAEKIRETWTLDDGYLFLGLLRKLGSTEVADRFTARLDVAKARGVGRFRDAMTVAGPALKVITNQKPVATDADLLIELGVPFKYASVDGRKLNWTDTPDASLYAASAAWMRGVSEGSAHTAKGLFLSSPTSGNGKTTFATILFKNLVLPKIRRGEKVRAQWHSTPELFAKLRNAFSADKRAEHGEGMEAPLAVERLIHADVLLLDDIGKERPTEWVLEQLYRIFEARHQTRTTIVTSNLTMPQLENHFGQALASRFADGYVKLKFTAPDWRRAHEAAS